MIDNENIKQGDIIVYLKWNNSYNSIETEAEIGASMEECQEWVKQKIQEEMADQGTDFEVLYAPVTIHNKAEIVVIEKSINELIATPPIEATKVEI